jgi:hypothetical protein
MFRQQRSSGIELLECLIDQSIMRRLDPFIGVLFGTHAEDCTGRIRTRWCSTQAPIVGRRSAVVTGMFVVQSLARQ